MEGGNINNLDTQEPEKTFDLPREGKDAEISLDLKEEGIATFGSSSSKNSKSETYIQKSAEEMNTLEEPVFTTIVYITTLYALPNTPLEKRFIFYPQKSQINFQILGLKRRED